jgi:hypothetical protein
MSNPSTQVNHRYWILISSIIAALALVAFVTLNRTRARSSVSATVSATHSAARRGGASSNSAINPDSGPNRTRMDTSPSNWTAKFQAADDYLKFVKDAVPAAQSGDGRASWYIGEALRSCALVMRTYRGSEDPETQLNQELASMPKAPQWARDLLAKKTHRCLGLARQDPFEGLPNREGGYPSSYWYSQALADGEPLAQEQAAADAIATVSVTRGMSEPEKASTLQAAQANLQAAVESGDPTALYRVGILLSDPRFSTNPLNGTAVALAACNLDQDCSANNPDNPFFNCKLSGACPADADFAYYLQQNLGPATYAQVDAHAQQIKQAIQAGDWSTVLGNLTIDKHP